MPKIALHIGLGKTGSSALQFGFESHREALRRLGVYYGGGRRAVKDLPGGISSGNGRSLAAFLNPTLRSPAFTTDAFMRSFDDAFLSDDCAIGLVSSEILATARPENLSAFLSDIVGGRDLVVIAFVRDLFPHARATWAQFVKRRAHTKSLADSAAQYPDFFQFGVIRKFEKIVGRERMRLVHYESAKQDLMGAFLAALDIGGRAFEVTLPSINRSLSDMEIAVLRKCNEFHCDRNLAKILSDGLIERHPGRVSTNAFDVELFDAYSDKHGQELTAMNQKYFGGKPVWKVGNGDPKSTASLTASESAEVIWADVVQLLIRELKTHMASPEGT